MIRIGLGLASALVLSAACGPSPEKLEAARVLRAVEIVRLAPARGDVEARLRLVEALQREPVTSPGASLARDRCAEAYRESFEAEGLIAESAR